MNKLPTFLYGGDYNPEQWPEETWLNDIQILKNAHVNSATINVFSWALLEPSEGHFDFTQLDRIIKHLSNQGFQIILGTSTAAIPAWLFKYYPDVARVDFQGRRHRFGQRHNFCPTSPNFRQHVSRLVTELAKRYANQTNVVAWHINNEYGGTCYCSNCQQSFQNWLKDRYHTLANLNQAWDTNVWSHTLHYWDEIMVPNELSDAWGPEGHHTVLEGAYIDYFRFQSEMMLDEYLMEKEIIRKYDQSTPVLTNFHSTPNKLINYQKWANSQDIIAYDSYPAYNAPWSHPAFLYDLMYSLKHQPFLLMESAPSQVNWQAYSPLKEPGQLRATELQAVAHGADSVQYFQLKQARGGTEKFHSAIISHSQTEDTRVFKEVQQLGEELSQVGPEILDSTITSKVALFFDWNSYWGYEMVDGVSKDMNYLAIIHDYYQTLYDRHLPVAIVGADDDLSIYDIIFAPVLYMVDENLDAKLHNYVKEGGHLVATFMSGMVNESDLIYPGGYPGPLTDLMGLSVEETDALPADQQVSVFFTDGVRKTATFLADQLRLTTAQPLANYASKFYAGSPAVATNRFGQGRTYYVGCRLSIDGLGHLVDQICEVAHINGLVEQGNPLEVTKRVQSDGTALYFILNLTHTPQNLPARFQNDYLDLLTNHAPKRKLLPWDVQILKHS